MWRRSDGGSAVMRPHLLLLAAVTGVTWSVALAARPTTCPGVNLIDTLLCSLMGSSSRTVSFNLWNPSDLREDWLTQPPRRRQEDPEPKEEDFFGAPSQEQLSASCGLLPIMPLIVGGRSAQQDNWRWIVRLGERADLGTTWRCGGTLISNRWVVTAAHCYQHVTSLESEVARLGEYDTSTTSDGRHQDLHLSRVVVHQQYRPPLKHNDIALLQLGRAVPLGGHVQAACLPRAGLPVRQVLVAGWGRMNFQRQSSPRRLQETRLQVTADDECEKAYRSQEWFQQYFGGGFGGSKLCATWQGDVPSDACVGDSGGPAVSYDTSTGRYRLVGIVSSGVKCADRNFPGIYTRVEKYVDWIVKTTK